MLYKIGREKENMQQLSLLIVMLAALIIPIIMARFKVSSIPTAIAEIITGIILGKVSWISLTPTGPLIWCHRWGSLC